MMEQDQEDNIRQSLTAFVDRELDPAQTLRALNYLIDHPEALRWVRDQQRLALAARRVFGSPTVTAPAALRERIAAMIARDDFSDGSVTEGPQPAERRITPTPRVLARSRWWMSAVAAILVISLIIVGWRDIWPHQTAAAAQSPEPAIPASIVAHATRLHADCSRLAAALHSAAFPESQGDLAKDVESDLHSATPYPKLSSIGYRFVGAGPCAEPLVNTVHLLYHSMTIGSVNTVSLFVQPYNGQFALQQGRLYSVANATSPFPMLVWRTERVVYFLIADDEKTEQKVLSLVRGLAGDTTFPSAATKKLLQGIPAGAGTNA